MHSDPIADMLTRVRNASTARHNQVVMPSSKMKASIAQVLADEGFIDAFAVTDEQPQPRLVMRLKYTSQGEPVIGNIQRVSKPGSRVYTGYAGIPWVRSGLGINILSTPNGVMTGRNAKRERVGGEIVCNVW